MKTIEAVAVLLAIEGAIVVLVVRLARGNRTLALLYLLTTTAPLEVYRTTVAAVNPSLFRLSLLIVAGTIASERIRGDGPSGSGTLDAVRLRQLRPAAAYTLLAAIVIASVTIGAGHESFLGRRLAVVIITGALATSVVVVLARHLSTEQLVRGVLVGAVPAILAGCWQALGPRLGAGSGLPLISVLPVDPGQETSRALTSFGAASSRMKGAFIDPNFFGLYLVFVVLLATSLIIWGLVERCPWKRLVLPAAVLPAGLAALAASYSRSAYGALIVGIAVMTGLLAPLLRGSGALRRYRRRLAVLGAGTLLALTPVLPTVVSRLTSQGVGNEQSNILHAADIHGGLREFRAHPLLGVGAGQLGVHLNQGPLSSNADSTYVTVAAELGAVGLFVLLLAVAWTLEGAGRAYWAVRRGAASAVLAALLGAYAGFALANVLYDAWWRDWHFVMLGVVLAASGTRSAGRVVAAS